MGDPILKIVKLIARANEAGICDPEWEQSGPAVSWFLENGGTEGQTIGRVDKHLPYGPYNAVLIPDSGAEFYEREKEAMAKSWDITRTAFLVRLKNATPEGVERCLRLFGKTAY